MANADKIVYLGKNQGGQAPKATMGKYGVQADACGTMMVQAIQPLLHDLFAQADDDLYRLAENSTSNARQTLFFDAMRGLRLFQEKAEKAYLRMLQNTFTSFWQGRPFVSSSAASSQGDDGEFSLVEKDELEEELAVTSMATKAQGMYHRELHALDRRFAHMLGKESIDSEQNPAGPTVLAEIFRVVLDDWETEEVLARIVVYKCFEKSVLSSLGDVYERMNLYLAEKGVLPELIQQRSGGRIRNRSSGANANRNVSRSPVDQGLAADDSVAHVPQDEATPSLQELWQYVRQLTAQGMPGVAGEAVGGVANLHLPVLPKNNVMDALSSMQSAALSDLDLENVEWAAVQERIRQQLSQTLCLDEAGNATHRFGEAEQQTIDVIMMLFDHVLDDANLPDAMRALIARLQIPVLKAAIADDSFVDDQQHPARRLLNDLAAASVGWRDDGDRSEKSLYVQVKRSVDRIVHEYTDDVSLFEEVLEEFAQFMEKRAKLKKMLEDRLTQAVSGEERLEVAKLRVEEVLRELGADYLPEAAREILQQPWKKLMTILLLREGEEGGNWRKAVNIAKLLVMYLGRDSGEVDRQKLLSSIPEMISGLKKGFSYISFDQKKSAAMLNKLQTCFISVLKHGEVVSDGQQAQPNDAEEQADTTEPAIEDAHSISVRNMKEGSWIRMQLDAEEEPLICKLVWRSKFTGTMVFVDGQGNKAGQMKEAELAAYFRDGSAKFLEDAQAPLIDRAIKKMMKVLNARIVGPKLQMSE
ncbi:DUF1631 domain-containing protein [Thiolapillus sp.]